MSVAAAIVNWNSGTWLSRCLESVVRDVQEIVVVDNASTDESLARAAGFADRATFIRNPENLGFAAAVNQGFSRTGAPYVLVLNPDVEASAGAISLLGAFLDAHPRAGAVGAYVNERYLPRRLATPWTVVRENLGIPDRRPHGAGSRVGQAAAAALMVRRTAYAEVGGFDEGYYPAWYEDVDFCRRLSNAQWEVHFLPQSRFVHEGGHSVKSLSPEAFAEAYYRNQLRYVRKHFGISGGLAVRGSLVAGMLGRIIARPARAKAYSRVIAGAFGGW